MSFTTREGKTISTKGIISVEEREPGLFGFQHKIVVLYNTGLVSVLKVSPSNAWWTMTRLKEFIDK